MGIPGKIDHFNVCKIEPDQTYWLSMWYELWIPAISTHFNNLADKHKKAAEHEMLNWQFSEFEDRVWLTIHILKDCFESIVVWSNGVIFSKESL